MDDSEKATPEASNPSVSQAEAPPLVHRTTRPKLKVRGASRGKSDSNSKSIRGERMTAKKRARKHGRKTP
jgi:hypothetical protein